MIKGMTGFGRAQGAASWGAWAWEARSVNGKSLDVRMAGPPGFDAVEFEAKKKVRERFARGSIQLQLRIDFTREAGGPAIDTRALNRLARSARSWASAGLARPTLDGLLAEIDGGRDPVPWVSARVKADAVAHVRAMARMPADQRARLLAHIEATPNFAD